MRALFADRDARLLLVGQGLSLFGDRAMYIVLGVWVKSLTGSNAQAGLVFFVLAIPGVVAPAFGLLVDRVRKRPLMIATDVAIAIILGALFFVHDRSDVWIIYAVTFLYGAAGFLFTSGQSALLHLMLPEERLSDANAVLQTASEGSRLIAPLVGAGLYAVIGGQAVAALDAATFLASAACLAGLRLREVRPLAPEHHILTQLLAGIAHIARRPGLRRIVLTVAATLLVVGFAETAIFAVLQKGIHRPPAFLGVLSAGQGVGAIAGALVAAKLIRSAGDARTVALGILLFGFGDAFFLIPNVAAVMVGIAIAGAGLSFAVVGFGTAIQLRTPGELQGRVYSAADTVVGTPQTVSIALGAAIVAVVDYRVSIAAMAVVCALCGGYLAVVGAPDDV
ncbi:MAG TPA: MFS transporter [Gaiellales bacterium]|nr:MFS transporter [Gaiellales bacterium]